MPGNAEWLDDFDKATLTTMEESNARKGTFIGWSWWGNFNNDEGITCQERQSLDDLDKATLTTRTDSNARKGTVIVWSWWGKISNEEEIKCQETHSHWRILIRQHYQRWRNRMPGKAQWLDDFDKATLTTMEESNGRKGPVIGWSWWGHFIIDKGIKSKERDSHWMILMRQH